MPAWRAPLLAHSRSAKQNCMLAQQRTHITFLFVVSVIAVTHVSAQTETASIVGTIRDAQGAPVPRVGVHATRAETGAATTSFANGSGVFALMGLTPGHYKLTVQKAGFKEIVTQELTLSVQDRLEQNFTLEIGSVSESVTVEATAPLVNTQDATVSTVVDRQFAENLPMNGRSFQSLIELTPGVVLTPNNGSETGQFSINGQRPDANYWMVDGVSANIGMSAAGYVGQGLAGSLGATNVFGGTNGLVSVDALQEFRIQTSTYAPEFGRAPGGQISIATRSGANQFHGSAFDYFRNAALDANDWFANTAGLAKPEERQNDFGGTLGGPVLKNRTFFFFSYEGMRLQLPQAALALVPDTNSLDPYSRQFAAPAMQPYLNAYPLPNGPEVLDSDGNHQGVAEFNKSFSNPGSLDAYSLRTDHKVSDHLSLFGRFNYSPSSLHERGLYSGLSSLNSVVSNTLTATAGATWTISPAVNNDFRFNFSRTNNYNTVQLDNFGGATPVIFPLPDSLPVENTYFRFSIFSLGNYSDLVTGAGGQNLQRQFNIVDSLSIQKGTHSLKVGVDYRRLSPSVVAGPGAANSEFYLGFVGFNDIPSASTGTIGYGGGTLTLPAQFLFRNLGVFAQDTWRVFPRLTVTYGLRWDTDFAPSTISGPNFAAVTGFNLHDLSNLALASPGTPPFATRYGNLAPRIGLAYQLSQNPRWQTVIRGGFGAFYDLATSESGNLYRNYNYPFGSSTFFYSFSANYPTVIPTAPIEPPNATNGGWLFGLDPKLKSPYTLEWNVAIEQALGTNQTFTASYIGAAGRDLIMSTWFSVPNPDFSSTEILVSNGGRSNYDALQLQFQRRLSAGLQALASYTWSHSLDTGSGGTASLAGVGSNVNYGNSGFDIRHAFTAGLTYDVPAPKANTLARSILKGWSLDHIIQARSAAPVDISYSFGQLALGQFSAPIRPDLTGQPVYLYGSQYPGGKAINPAAFSTPPLTPAGCLPGVDPVCNSVSPGTLERNSVRGFGMYQWDFAVHREFPIRESTALEFRAEMFNVLNHPNFAPPASDLGAPPPNGNPQFGLASQMLGQGLSGGNVGAGAFSPLYQVGGPRSIQLALKLHF